MEEAERLCDRVAIVDHGKIIALNSPHDLVTTYFKESVIEFDTFSHLSYEQLTALPGVGNVVNDDDSTTLYTTAVAQTISGLLEVANGHSSELTNLFVRHASLEDVFLKLTGRRIRE